MQPQVVHPAVLPNSFPAGGHSRLLFNPGTHCRCSLLAPAPPASVSQALGSQQHGPCRQCLDRRSLRRLCQLPWAQPGCSTATFGAAARELRAVCVRWSLSEGPFSTVSKGSDGLPMGLRTRRDCSAGPAQGQLLPAPAALPSARVVPHEAAPSQGDLCPGESLLVGSPSELHPGCGSGKLQGQPAGTARALPGRSLSSVPI